MNSVLSKTGGVPILPYTYAQQYRVLLMEYEADRDDTAYYSRLPPLPVINEIQRATDRAVKFRKVPEDHLKDALITIYQDKSSKELSNVSGLGSQIGSSPLDEIISETIDVLDQEDEAPIIKLISSILSEATREGASDIHFSSDEKIFNIKFRIDGKLREVASIERKFAPLIVSRIKVMAKLDIAEKRIPQDGRTSILSGGKDIELRISTMPANYGERIVMRILNKSAGQMPLEELGLSYENLSKLNQALQLPHGIILATGPTGSGKTTMLYSALTRINDGQKNILTIEDPIEYQLDGIGQTQVNTKSGMTFAKGLRSMLRQDPDVIMVGEIRDEETLRIAIQASLTGHLVLSTLHTNTAIGAVNRMIDMGIEPYLLSSTLSALIAQRLVRKLCHDCRETHIPTEEEQNNFELNSLKSTVFKASDHGCPSCKGQGYRGRIALYEIVTVDEVLKEMIHDRQSEAELTKYARRFSRSIRQDGVEKINNGITSIDEVLHASSL